MHHQFGRPHVVAQAHMNQLAKGQPIKPSDGATLQKLARQMIRCELTLTQMGCVADLNNSETLFSIMDRLPLYLQTKWAERAETIFKHGERPQFSDLAKFVQQSADVANSMFGQHLSETKNKDKGSKVKQRNRLNEVPSRATTLAVRGNQNCREKTQRQEASSTFRPPNSGLSACPECPSCSKPHVLSGCEDFKKKSYEERLQVMRQSHICYNCLIPGHYAKGCAMKRACVLPGCQRKHHTLLHPPSRMNDTREVNNKETSQDQPRATNQTQQQASLAVMSSARDGDTGIARSRVCLRVVPVQV